MPLVLVVVLLFGVIGYSQGWFDQWVPQLGTIGEEVSNYVYPDAQGRCPAGWEQAHGKTLTFIAYDAFAGSALSNSHYLDIYDASAGVDNAVPQEVDKQHTTSGVATSGPYATGTKLVWWFGDNTAIGSASTLVFFGKDIDSDGYADPLSKSNPQPYVVPCLTPGTNEQASTIYVPMKVRIHDASAAAALSYGTTQFTASSGFINKTTGVPGVDSYTLRMDLMISNNKGYQSSYDFINHEAHEPIVMLYLNKQTDAVNSIIVSGFSFCEQNAGNGDDTFCLLRLSDDSVSALTTDSGKTYIISPDYSLNFHVDMSGWSSATADSRLYLTLYMGDINYWIEKGKSATAQGYNPVDLVADWYYLLGDGTP